MSISKERYKLVMEDRKRLLEFLLKKDGKTLKELYREGRQDFINRNLDLLTPEELKKFAPLFVDGKVVLSH